MKAPRHSMFAALTSSRLCLVVPIGALVLLGGPSAQAADRIWDGTGSNNANWLTKQNWGNNDVAANDALFFGGTLRTTNNNDTTADTNYSGLTFNIGAGAFVLGGNQITLGGDVTNNSASTQTINLPMILSATRDFNAETGSIAVGGVISGTGGLTKTGGNTLTLSGATNTYTGLTTVSQGKLIIGSSGTINSTSSVSIGAGEFNYNSGTALSQPVSFSGTGGKLTGTGTITPAVTVTTGNTYSAGEAGDPGTQTLTGGLALDGGIFSWDLDATATDPGVNTENSGTYDKVIGSGSGSGIFEIVLGTNAFTDAFWDTNKTWTDIFSVSAPSFTFGGTSVDSNGTVLGQGKFSFSGKTLSWTAVPEPTSALAALLLGAGLLRRRRDAMV